MGKAPRTAPLLRLFVFLGLLLCGCQTARLNQVAQTQDVPRVEQTFSEDLTSALSNKFGLYKDIFVEKKISKIVDQLIRSNTELQSLNYDFKIYILNTPFPFFSSGLNGSIYLSKSILVATQYENELAYILSCVLVLMKNDVAHKRLLGIIENRSYQEVKNNYALENWFMPAGFFDFGVNEYFEAEREAIHMPTKIRYDFRGAATIFKRMAEKPLSELISKHWKIEPSIQERYDNIKEETVKLYPQRNAILKNKDFEEFKRKVTTK